MTETRECLRAERARDAPFDVGRIRAKRERGHRAARRQFRARQREVVELQLGVVDGCIPEACTNARCRAAQQTIRDVEQTRGCADIGGSQSYAPMMHTAATFDIGEPPRLCVMPIEGLASCRSA